MRLAALLVLVPGLGAADPDRVSVLFGSHHVVLPDRPDDPGGYVPIGAASFEWQEVNPGLFLTWEADPLDWTAGLFRNSYGDWSPAVFASFDLVTWEGGALSALAGLARYDHMTGRIGVPVAPLAGLQVRHGNLFANLLPGGGDAPVVIAGGITFDIN